jgi:hypothetical protein
MPAVFWKDGFKFHFYSSEGDPREPIHIHVAKRGEGDAKLWLYPRVSFAYNYGFDARTQTWLIRIAEEHREQIESAWNEHFGSGD